MFSGRRDRVWSDNSIHPLLLPKTGRIPHVVLIRHITNRVAIQSPSSPLRQPRGNEPQGFDECWADTLAFRS